MVDRLPHLREWRLSRFLTQQELSDRSGVSTVTIWRLETGRKGPVALPTIRKLADALGIERAELVHGRPSKSA